MMLEQPSSSRTPVNVLAVGRDAFQALFSGLSPVRDFFGRLIEERMGPGPPAAAGHQQGANGS